VAEAGAVHGEDPARHRESSSQKLGMRSVSVVALCVQSRRIQARERGVCQPPLTSNVSEWRARRDHGDVRSILRERQRRSSRASASERVIVFGTRDTSSTAPR